MGYIEGNSDCVISKKEIIGNHGNEDSEQREFGWKTGNKRRRDRRKQKESMAKENMTVHEEMLVNDKKTNKLGKKRVKKKEH